MCMSLGRQRPVSASLKEVRVLRCLRRAEADRHTSRSRSDECRHEQCVLRRMEASVPSCHPLLSKAVAAPDASASELDIRPAKSRKLRSRRRQMPSSNWGQNTLRSLGPDPALTSSCTTLRDLLRASPSQYLGASLIPDLQSRLSDVNSLSARRLPRRERTTGKGCAQVPESPILGRSFVQIRVARATSERHSPHHRGQDSVPCLIIFFVFTLLSAFTVRL